MSLYAVTLPCFAQMLRSLTTLLAKGEEHARARGFDAQNLLDARLAPDMHTLARQVEFSCTQAQEAVCRLTRQPLPRLATPASMDDARALIERTLAILCVTIPLILSRAALCGVLVAGTVAVLAFSLPYKLGLLVAVVVGMVSAMAVEEWTEKWTKRHV